MKNLLQLHFYAEKEGKTYRRLFPTTLLRAFAPKGAWDFCPKNEKNRLRCGQIDHGRAGFR